MLHFAVFESAYSILVLRSLLSEDRYIGNVLYEYMYLSLFIPNVFIRKSYIVYNKIYIIAIEYFRVKLYA